MSYQDAFNLVVLLRCTEIRNVWGIVMCKTWQEGEVRKLSCD